MPRHPFRVVGAPGRAPRALALWGAAIAVALVTGAVVAGDLATLQRRAESLGPERDALVASHDLPVGSTVEEGDLRIRRVHTSQVTAGVLSDPSTASGRVVAVPVLRGSYVARRHLTTRHRTGLDGSLPPATRAVRVPVAGAIRPRVGAAVDVLATFPGDEPETVVVAAGALVLATDRGTGGETADGAVAGVTVLVEADQAERLAFASANGVLDLALVPPEEAAPVPMARPRARRP
jgi:Flp pilus assembly protein CpaB